jgi:hypothetical protein
MALSQQSSNTTPNSFFNDVAGVATPAKDPVSEAVQTAAKLGREAELKSAQADREMRQAQSGKPASQPTKTAAGGAVKNGAIASNQSSTAVAKKPQTSEEFQRKLSDFERSFRRMMRFVVIALTFVIRILTYFINPPGSAIFFGAGALYFLAVNIEGYWQSVGYQDIAFVPKPFIDDGYAVANIFAATLMWEFWIMMFLSLTVQAVQSWSLADRMTNRPEKGSNTARKIGAMVLLGYGIDFAIALANFPLFGLALGPFVVNLCWAFLSIFGAELFIALFMVTIKSLYQERV